jgi:hypothetical protein
MRCRKCCAKVFGRQDLVIVHNVATMPFDLELTATISEISRTLPKTRFLCWVHDLAADGSAPTLFERHPGYAYVTVSAERQRRFEKLTGGSCRVVPNGIDPAELLGLSTSVGSLLRKERILDREFVLLHPTRLVRRKNIEFALYTVAALKAAGRNVCYLLTAASDPHTPGRRVCGLSSRAPHAARAGARGAVPLRFFHGDKAGPDQLI